MCRIHMQLFSVRRRAWHNARDQNRWYLNAYPIANSYIIQTRDLVRECYYIHISFDLDANQMAIE